MENILVTGGAGYVGSVLVAVLLDAGYSVTVVDNFYYRQNSLASHFHNPRLSAVVGDVRDEKIIKDLVRSHDVVFPLAAIVGAPACDQRSFDARSVNLDSTMNLFRWLSPSQLLVMPTTNSAYGSGSQNQVFTEKSSLNPISSYARDKVLVEEEMMQRENSVSFRLATVFGMSPRMRLDLLVNNFVFRSILDGYLVLFEPHFTRNYIHVRDVAEAFLLALRQRDAMVGNVFNVGLSNANLTKMELATEIKKQIPHLAILVGEHQHDPDQRNYTVSNEKIENLGFSPTFSIQAGIGELLRGIPTLSVGNYFNSF